MATVPIDYHVGYIQILLYQQSFNEDVHAYICEHHKIDAREIFINLEKKQHISCTRVYFAKKVLKKEKKNRSYYKLSSIVLEYFIDDKLKSRECYFITVLIFTI